MRLLATAALAALLGGAAHGQADPPRIGIFFSAGGEDLELQLPVAGEVHPQAVLVATPGAPLRINVVALGLTGAGELLQGFELGVVVPDLGVPLTAWEFMGGGPGVDGAHPAEPGSYSRAHAWTEPRPIAADHQVLMWAQCVPAAGIGTAAFKLGPYGAAARQPRLLIDGAIVPCTVVAGCGSGPAPDDGGFAVAAGTADVCAAGE